MDRHLFILGLIIMLHDDYSLCTKHFWEMLNHFNICLWLCAESYDCSNSIPIWLHCNYVIHDLYKENVSLCMGGSKRKTGMQI